MSVAAADTAPKRVIVTRPLGQALSFVTLLRQAGIDAVALPLIEIRPAADAQPLRQASAELPALAMVMFVSANAVLQFMRHRPSPGAWPAGVLAASTGPGTSAALRDAGVPGSALVEPAGTQFDSEALWQQIKGRDWAGRRVLVVRGEQGRDWLAEQLGQAGASVAFVSAYERHVPQLQDAEKQWLEQAMAQPASWLWLFSSSEAVANLGRLVPTADWSRGEAMASHPRIAARARQLGFGRVALGELSVAALQHQLSSAVGRSIQSKAQ